MLAGEGKGGLLCVGSKRIEEMRIESATEAVAHPGNLSFGELACGDDAEFDGFIQCGIAVQMLPELAVADAAHGWMLRGELRSVAQLPHFVEKARGHHGVEALGDTVVQEGTIRQKGKGERSPGWRDLALRGVEFAWGLAGEDHEFVGAQEALRVVVVDAGSALRIARGEFGMECGKPFIPQARFECGAQCGVCARQVGKTGKDGVVVEHGAACEQGDASASVNVCDEAGDVALAVAGTVAGFRRQDVDQVMRVACQKFAVGLGAADIEALIDLRGVNTDDFQRQGIIESAGEIGFAGGSRPDEADDGQIVMIHVFDKNSCFLPI